MYNVCMSSNYYYYSYLGIEKGTYKNYLDIHRKKSLNRDAVQHAVTPYHPYLESRVILAGVA